MKGEETENKKIGCTVNLMVRGHGPFLLYAQWNLSYSVMGLALLQWL